MSMPHIPPAPPVIDAHQHFWCYNHEEYGWIPPEWAPLRRDFLPADLEKELAAAGVHGSIAVQARQSMAETDWLLELADRHDFLLGVVGWLPLIDPSIEEHLDRISNRPKLRALRHVLQGEPDDSYMLRSDFNRGLRALAQRGLAYDVLVYERHLPQVIQLVDAHPDITFILDHVAKPRIAARELEPWAKNLRELARRPHVACKLSGMVTEADVRHWSPSDLRPYFEIVIEAFGPARLLFGSDWPVCLAGVTYGTWKQIVTDALGELSSPELDAVFGANTARLYRLTDKSLAPKSTKDTKGNSSL
jgi:L-fuconolactonase